MSVQNIDICDYMSKQDIQLCKKFLSTASERGMSSKVCKLFCFKLNFHTSALKSGT